MKDTNTWVDVLGLSGELVYQLIRDNKVVYYGITSRTALERMAAVSYTHLDVYKRQLKNMLHKAICTVTGHPVDVASGTFFTDEEDF